MEEKILKAAQLLRKGELVAIPTETVYGLAANAFLDDAIRSIYELKNRPLINPLIFHVKSIDCIYKLAKNVPNDAIKLAEAFWPGPLTMVLDKKDHISDLATAGKRTIGIRMPDHEVTLNLLEMLEFPLVAPSANRSNHISPTSADHVRQSFKDRAPDILDGGDCKTGIESTIVGFKTDGVYLYRQGAISINEIEALLGCKVLEMQNEVSPESPGMFKKHYSPNTPLYIADRISSALMSDNDKRVGLISYRENHVEFNAVVHRSLSENGDLNEAASNLYAALYELDSLGLDFILVERVPERGIGKAINDRLTRAAKETIDINLI